MFILLQSHMQIYVFSCYHLLALRGLSDFTYWGNAFKVIDIYSSASIQNSFV